VRLPARSLHDRRPGHSARLPEQPQNLGRFAVAPGPLFLRGRGFRALGRLPVDDRRLASVGFHAADKRQDARRPDNRGSSDTQASARRRSRNGALDAERRRPGCALPGCIGVRVCQIKSELLHVMIAPHRKVLPSLLQ
jgi:hypothetical protein